MKYIIIICFSIVLLHYHGGACPLIDGHDDSVQVNKKDKRDITKNKKDTDSSVKDSDMDGVSDSEDECPGVPGTVATKGCPDSDGDGIPDHLDDCIHVSGLAQFRGCPDSDGDGIPDDKDVCPFEYGSAANNGCPLSPDVELTKMNIDSLDLERELDLQMQRYEKYTYEKELRELEYEEYLKKINENRQKMEEGKKGKRTANEIKVNVNDSNKTKQTSSTQNTTIAKETETDTKTSKVTIDNALFQIYVAELEILLNDIKFQKGRVYFVDEYKSFDALNKLASLCESYPEWTKLTFYIYSYNETINNNSFRSNNLFSNRVDALKAILIKQRKIAANRFEFKNITTTAPDEPNFIKLDVRVQLSGNTD
ncbi:MAG: thrombospondin type 3 repeat-containing protein [Prevotellaceae bacterium]|jgi:hypothetical protein|nr:thrombospondin type 3 repeat-containing protein [Prevotellaceae bacterium]